MPAQQQQPQHAASQTRDRSVYTDIIKGDCVRRTPQLS